MKAGRPSSILRTTLPFLAACAGTLCSILLSTTDNSLRSLFGPTQMPASAWQTLVVTTPITYLIFEAGLRVGKKFLALAMVQSLAVAVAVSLLAGQYCRLGCSVLSPLVAALAAVILGRTLRALKDAEIAQTSRFFELALKNQELSQTRLALLKQDEAERRLLASDLHDQVLADLRELSEKSQIFGDNKEIDQLIKRTTANIREVMENLSPSVLENLGLPAALDELVRKSSAIGKFQGRFRDDLNPATLAKLSRTEQLLVFRLAQEAVNNIVKHAAAKKVFLSLSAPDDRTILLVVKDDGVGLPEAKKNSQSRGMRYMKLKADIMGGQLTWTSPPPDPASVSANGTEVKLKLTLKD